MTCDQGPDAAGPAPPLGGVSRWVDLDGAVNWSAIAPLLTDRFRLLAPDLAGHGLTRAAGRGTDVAANQVLLHHFIESVPGAPVILMGNSMGGMISLLEASAAPDAVAGLILLDPALPFVPVRPDPVVTALFALQATPRPNRILAAPAPGQLA